MTTYAKDTRKNNLIVDYSNTFGTVGSTEISLINCCRYIHKDKGGEYSYIAELHEKPGYVIFKKVYIRIEEGGIITAVNN